MKKCYWSFYQANIGAGLSITRDLSSEINRKLLVTSIHCGSPVYNSMTLSIQENGRTIFSTNNMGDINLNINLPLITGAIYTFIVTNYAGVPMNMSMLICYDEDLSY